MFASFYDNQFVRKVERITSWCVRCRHPAGATWHQLWCIPPCQNPEPLRVIVGGSPGSR
jgi:hypothetical protein